MTVSYLDVDDEITDAVARLRAAEDGRFVLVLPPGSRIASSRIHFRLLAREGRDRGVLVGLVARDPGARSLAIAAGVPAYATVEEAESALGPAAAAGGAAGQAPPPPASHEMTPAMAAEPMVAQARHVAGGPPERAHAAPWPAVPGGPGNPAPSATGPDAQPTRVLPRSSAAVGAGASAAGVAPRGLAGPWADEPAAVAARPRSRRGRRAVGLLVRLAVIGAIAGIAIYAAYLTLPNVTVTLRPASTAAGPVTLDITADPAVAVPDEDAGIVPAERVEIPLSASGEFPVTGVEVTETRATGQVRLSSENTVVDISVPQGTIVATSDGIEFETTDSVIVPRAVFETGQRGEVDVAVRAVEPGPRGNVPTAAIDRIVQYAQLLISVSNERPTDGGTRAEVAVATRADHGSAMAALEAELDAELAAALADPATTPRGLRLFPETAARDPATPDIAAGDLVGRQAPTFTLTAASRAMVLAVDEALVREMAADRLAADMPAGARLFPESVQVSVGEPTVVGAAIVYRATVTAEQYVPLDHGALVEAIRGRTVSEARGILEAFGSVEIAPWPDFIGTVPDDARRINLTVLEPERRTP